MAESVERLELAARPGEPGRDVPGGGGLTWASALIGSALFLVLAWNLPSWSLAKGYKLGMGGNLPLEALIVYGLIVGQFAMAAFWNLLGLCGSACPDAAGLLPGIEY